VLGERDCSVQRRHQKVVEEAPAPHLSDATRRTLHEAARNAAKALGYRNAGTVEFLVDPAGRVYFLEVNRRLQVEHPVTEAVFGVDLVAWQLRVAAGEALPPEGTWTPRGHAVEVRVCAEDPANEFMPASGTIRRLVEPTGPGVRVDGGFVGGDEVPPFYDSLLMKVIASGETRDAALDRLDAALASTAILGVKSNVAFLRRVLADPDFRAARLSTDFLDGKVERLVADDGDGTDAVLVRSRPSCSAWTVGRGAAAGPWAGGRRPVAGPRGLPAPRGGRGPMSGPSQHGKWKADGGAVRRVDLKLDTGLPARGCTARTTPTSRRRCGAAATARCSSTSAAGACARPSRARATAGSSRSAAGCTRSCAPTAPTRSRAGRAATRSPSAR
jgi:3-methylcrotonyl-CoA carboxylase alpha subunit